MDEAGSGQRLKRKAGEGAHPSLKERPVHDPGPIGCGTLTPICAKCNWLHHVEDPGKRHE